MSELWLAIRGALAEWQRLQWSELFFAQQHAAILVCAVLLMVAVLTLVARSFLLKQPGRTSVVLPALLPVVRGSARSGMRHAPLVLFLIGVPVFAIALADPRTAFLREEVSYPGRRIAMLVDGSVSMVMRFETRELRAVDVPVFYTAVAAAERFMKLRMSGPYRDLIALIQFGNEAYVVTPFTTDYQNIMLSVRLIGEPREWGRFNDGGTTIIKGLNQATALFKAFDFQNASGNLMLVFTDGRDTQADLEGRPLADVVDEARRLKIPVYMIRTAYRMKFGDIKADTLWRAAVERTGGRFYAGSDEAAVLQAISEIDRLSPGRIDTMQYSSQRPRFAGFVLIALTLWLAAAWLQLGFRVFRTFP